MSRKCGVCQVIGHNVRSCSDVGAGVALAELMNEPILDRALVKCGVMPPRYVLFALCHGFGAPSSGGRKKLIELINAKFGVDMPTPVQAPRRQVQDLTVPVPRRHVPLRQVPTVPVPVPAPLQASRLIPAMVNIQEQVQHILSSAGSLGDVMSELHTILRETIMREAEFRECVNMWKFEHLRDDVIFLQRGYSPFSELTEVERIEIRHQHIKQAARLVLAKLVTEVINQRNYHRSINVVFDDNAFINRQVNSVSLMHEYITSASNELGLQLSNRAMAYIITIAQMQNCARHTNYITRLIGATEVPPRVVVNEMKTLKTVVSCRKSDVETPTTCGICFDDLAPNLVVKTGCGHNFCSDCIGGWAAQRGIKSFIVCPCCRGEIDVLECSESEYEKVSSGLLPVVA